jgi:hypothetical protein
LRLLDVPWLGSAIQRLKQVEHVRTLKQQSLQGKMSVMLQYLIQDSCGSERGSNQNDTRMHYAVLRGAGCEVNLQKSSFNFFPIAAASYGRLLNLSCNRKRPREHTSAISNSITHTSQAKRPLHPAIQQ